MPALLLPPRLLGYTRLRMLSLHLRLRTRTQHLHMHMQLPQVLAQAALHGPEQCTSQLGERRQRVAGAQV